MKKHSIEGLHFRKLIAQGTFAEVYLAESEITGKPYAVKCINKQQEHQVADVWFEPALLEELRHPLIVSLEKTIDTKEYMYIIQEYCECDLFHVISNGISEQKARKFFGQICEAVGFCHSKSVFHRDLKPENILISNGDIRLADFGLSSTEVISDGARIGSDRYMSPEVYASGITHLNSANDVWALGIILINLLTVSNPWSAASKDNIWFLTYLRNPIYFLQKQFRFSSELCNILKSVFSIDPSMRPTAYQLGKSIESIKFFMTVSNVNSQIVLRKPYKIHQKSLSFDSVPRLPDEQNQKAFANCAHQQISIDHLIN